MIRRRALLILACGLAGLTTAVLGLQLARAADPAQRVMRLGFVGTQTPSTAPHWVAAFWDRLRELGWVKGQNLVVEERWADGDLDRLPALMTDVVRREVDIIFTYNTAAATAAKKATSTTPIVVVGMGDPVATGLAASLASPGGNLTGLSLAWSEGIPGKWLELLHDVVPQLTSVAVLVYPGHPVVPQLVKALQAAAAARRLKLKIIEVRKPESLDRAFDQARGEAQAVLVPVNPMLMSQRQRVTALAAKHRLPAMYTVRDFVDAGGLMAYSPDFVVMFRRAADYVDKILKGAKPGDLPIEQPTTYELVVNLKTAKALGLTIPESILLRADEVIR